MKLTFHYLVEENSFALLKLLTRIKALKYFLTYRKMQEREQEQEQELWRPIVERF